MTDYEKLSSIGILIAGIAWLALFLKGIMKEHREERKEWQQSQEKRDEEHNRSLERNTKVLSELTTLIKTIKK